MRTLVIMLWALGGQQGPLPADAEARLSDRVFRARERAVAEFAAKDGLENALRRLSETSARPEARKNADRAVQAIVARKRASDVNWLSRRWPVPPMVDAAYYDVDPLTGQNNGYKCHLWQAHYVNRWQSEANRMPYPMEYQEYGYPSLRLASRLWALDALDAGAPRGLVDLVFSDWAARDTVFVANNRWCGTAVGPLYTGDD
jgi:hypothetical protein